MCVRHYCTLPLLLLLLLLFLLLSVVSFSPTRIWRASCVVVVRLLVFKKEKKHEHTHKHERARCHPSVRLSVWLKWDTHIQLSHATVCMCQSLYMRIYIFFLNNTHCTIYYMLSLSLPLPRSVCVYLLLLLLPLLLMRIQNGRSAVVVLNNIQSEDVYSIVRARNTHRASTTQQIYLFSI